MKILIVIDSLGGGGAERSTAVISDYLYSNGISFQVVCIDTKLVGFQKDMIDKGYDVQFFKSRYFFVQIYELVQIIKKGKFSLVHSILFKSNIRTRWAKLFVNFQHLESLVNTTYSDERKKDIRVNSTILALYKILDRITAGLFVDHFHSITKTVAEHYIKEINIDKTKITTIFRGRKSINEFKTIDTGKIILINVGRHEFQKGQIHLLRAVNLLKTTNDNFHLNIFGRNGEETDKLKNYIAENNLEKFVTLHEFSNNIGAELVNSDIFVFPSLYEGLGGALIEAQAAGLPIACNNIPVLHEVVVDGGNAKFFDVYNLNSIVDSIKFYLDNPEERIKHGTFSKKHFQDNFLESVNNKKMLDLYKQLCLKSEN